MFSTLGEVTQRQNQQRKEIIAELAATNARLETILAENSGLHTQLLAQAREAGILDERQRMAREIHDTLAQGFTGIIAQIEAAKLAPQDAAQRQQHLDLAQALARDSLASARRSVQALRPAPLEQSHLPEAVAGMAERWSETAAVSLSIATTGEPRPLPAEAEVALFRVAQEALNNVAKHASASRVGVTLTYTGSLVLLDVRDDGVGFAVAAENGAGTQHGFGLGTMADRLRLVGGDLEIESAPGEGTSINARVPALPVEGGA
jgi:signal transduction histidine kinase